MRGCEAIVVELPGYVGGKLDSPTAGSVQRHLQGCAGCQAELRQVERLDHLLAVSLPSIVPSPTFASSFANRLAAEIVDEGVEKESFSPRSLLSWLVQPWLIPVGAAAVLAAIMFSPWFASEQQAGWSLKVPGVTGPVASSKQAPADTTKMAAKPSDAKAVEKKVVASTDQPPPDDVLSRPELFVDYAIIRDLDILDSDKAG